jgi:hypothetical protein
VENNLLFQIYNYLFILHIDLVYKGKLKINLVKKAARWFTECRFKSVQRGKTERYLLGEEIYSTGALIWKALKGKLNPFAGSSFLKEEK